MHRLVILFSFMFCITFSSNAQYSPTHQSSMMSLTHYIFPSIYTMFTQVCNQREAFEVVTISELSTGKKIIDSPLVLMSEPIGSYIPVTPGFEIKQVTIRDRKGELHYRSHSATEQIQLTHLQPGSYILSGLDEKGNAISVIFRKA